MNVVLLHGMGRTSFSMFFLKKRLASKGLKPSTFGYLATLESFNGCVQRLVAHLQKTIGEEPYILVGHSLGAVLIRAALPQLFLSPPKACFFLAPPSKAAKVAMFLSGSWLYRRLTGEMGQLLAQSSFMSSLPIPTMPVKIYAGIAGPTGAWSPFGYEPNDGVLTLAEVKGALTFPVVLVPTLHTWIMNSRVVAEDIVKTVGQL